MNDIPVISLNQQEAEDWFAVYSALARHAVANPPLGHTDEMRRARKIAYDRVSAAFEVL